MPPLYPHYTVQLPITSDKQQHFVDLKNYPRSSTPTYNATLESFLEFLIVAYLIWAIFYLFYATLCCTVWIWRESFRVWQNRCTEVMIVGFRHGFGCKGPQNGDVMVDDSVEEVCMAVDEKGSLRNQKWTALQERVCWMPTEADPLLGRARSKTT